MRWWCRIPPTSGTSRALPARLGFWWSRQVSPSLLTDGRYHSQVRQWSDAGQMAAVERGASGVAVRHESDAAACAAEVPVASGSRPRTSPSPTLRRWQELSPASSGSRPRTSSSGSARSRMRCELDIFRRAGASLAGGRHGTGALGRGRPDRAGGGRGHRSRQLTPPVSAAGVSDHRRLRSEQRLSARPSDRSAAQAGRPGACWTSAAC